MENYLKEYGEVITHISYPDKSEKAKIRNEEFLTLLMKYCPNIKSLESCNIMKEDFFIESLEDVIGVFNNFQNLHLCTNIRRIKYCVTEYIPTSLINIISIIRCSLSQIPNFIMYKLEECIMNGLEDDLDDYNHLLNPNLLRITTFKSFPKLEQISKFPKLEIVIIEANYNREALKKLTERFPHIKFYYDVEETPFDIRGYMFFKDESLFEEGEPYSNEKISLKIETLTLNFEDVYKKMLKIKYLHSINVDYTDDSTITPNQIKKIIISFPYLTNLNLTLKTEDYEEFRRIVDKYNDNISFIVTIIDLEEEDVENIARMSTNKDWIGISNREIWQFMKKLPKDE